MGVLVWPAPQFRLHSPPFQTPHLHPTRLLSQELIEDSHGFIKRTGGQAPAAIRRRQNQNLGRTQG